MPPLPTHRTETDGIQYDDPWTPSLNGSDGRLEVLGASEGKESGTGAKKMDLTGNGRETEGRRTGLVWIRNFGSGPG